MSAKQMRKQSTSAKHKLNSANVTGAVVVAGLAAAVVGSWPVFWLVVIFLVVTAVHSGDIRR